MDGFLEYVGATDILLAKRLLFVGAVLAVGAMTSLVLPSLLTRPALVIQGLRLVKRMWVRASFGAETLVKLDAKLVTSQELSRHVVNMGLTFWRTWWITTNTREALAVRTGHGGHQLLILGLFHKGVNAVPVLPLKPLVLPRSDEPVINSKDAFKIKSIVHNYKLMDIRNLVCKLFVDIVGGPPLEPWSTCHQAAPGRTSPCARPCQSRGH